MLDTQQRIYGADEFIDASYEGDLMAASNVTYTVGRESQSQYGEALAGVEAPTIWNGTQVDPYVIPGDPSSGLLPHLESGTLGAPHTADKGVMAYNYRLCLSSDPNNQIPFAAPAGYDPMEFEVNARIILGEVQAGRQLTFSSVCDLYGLPNKKFDVNDCTDDVGASFNYPDATPSERRQIAGQIREFVQGYLYFVLTDPRLPAAVQTQLQGLGLCKDEFLDNGGWPRQLYVREARRMVGQYVMTELDVEAQTNIPDSIGLGGFQIDSHFVNRLGGKTSVWTEGNIEKTLTQAYPISYRALTPLPSQATNLLVPVAVSASRTGFISLRVEPTFMVMGQAAGAAASLAIDENSSVQNVSYTALSQQLIAEGQAVSPDACKGPSAVIVPTSLAFGSQKLHTSSASQQVSLMNMGKETLNFTSIGVTGADASSFVFTNTCGASLIPNTRCVFSGHFAPAKTGPLTATIVITDSASDSPQSIVLTGTGQ